MNPFSQATCSIPPALNKLKVFSISPVLGSFRGGEHPRQINIFNTSLVLSGLQRFCIFLAPLCFKSPLGKYIMDIYPQIAQTTRSFFARNTFLRLNSSQEGQIQKGEP